MHIGRYEVVRELKGGGMGSVTLCRAPSGDLVVLKRPYSTEADAAVRLRDEARLGQRLTHPGLVETLDFFEHEGRPVLVVAYVDGMSMEIMRRIGPMPVPVVARIGRVIADALDAIHNAEDEDGRPLHILHRDVTPGNILLNRDGYAKLIDLGIARFSEREAEATQDGFLRGTMRYLAPELLEGGGYSTATDLWALGMVLWEAALGRFAYRGETDREVLAGIVMGRPMKLAEGEHMDPDLRAAIEPLLQRLPVVRTNDAAEAAARFAQLEDSFGDTTPLARETLEDFFERKDPSVELPVLGEGGGLDNRHYLGETGFEDVVTHAESEKHRPDDELEIDVDPTFTRGPPAAMSALSVGPQRAMDIDDERTHPLEDASDPLMPQATAAVPAPVDFDPLTGLPRAPLIEDARAYGAVEDDDDEEATITDLRPPDAARAARHADDAESATAAQVAAVRDALLALESMDNGEPVQDEDAHPPFSAEEEATLSMANPIPREAFRSDLEERAEGFEEGVSIEAPVAAPAPQIDDDDLEQMHTLDGLRPAGRPGRRAARSPSWDAVERVKVSSPGRSHLRTGFEDDEEPTESRIARLGLVKKTRQQAEEERRSKPPPEPGVSSKPRVNIDALPSAKPKAETSPTPREEHADVDALSPFSGPTEVAEPPASLIDAARPSIDVPNLALRDPTEADTGRMRPAPRDQDRSEIQLDSLDIEESEPTAIDLRPGDSPGELRMDTAVGAKIEEMPPLAQPIEPLKPLAPMAPTESWVDDEGEDTRTEKKAQRAFQAGETVSLGDIANLLDDD